MPDDLVDRLGRAALVTAFPFVFMGRTGIGELFPSVGRLETGARGLITLVGSQLHPATRGAAGLQLAALEEIAERALMDEVISFPSRAARLARRAFD